MNKKQLFEQLIARQDLTPDQMEAVVHECMSGQMNDVQLASFLALMRMKGETEAELTAATKVMMELAHTIPIEVDAIDIVGTGGDGRNTFNVSTACSFVVAAAGIPVAKHGNRSVSSKSGSTDLLEQAGFVLNLEVEQIKQCLEACNLAFLFAPNYHPAMQKARAARQQLEIRTFFNLLGPVINPARVKRQVLGVFAPKWQAPVAQVLKNMGSIKALVVHSHDGLDEISIAAPTAVVELNHGQINQWVLNPADYGLKHDNLDAVTVNSPQESLALIEGVLNNQSGPANDMVVLNAAAGIYCGNHACTFAEAIEQAKAAIRSGKALQTFNTLRELTRSMNPT